MYLLHVTNIIYLRIISQNKNAYVTNILEHLQQKLQLKVYRPKTLKLKGKIREETGRESLLCLRKPRS